MEIWRDYYESFVKKLSRIPDDAFERKELLYQAAHDTYEDVTNALTNAGIDAENALYQAKKFSTAAKSWIDRGSTSPQDLEQELAELNKHP